MKLAPPTATMQRRPARPTPTNWATPRQICSRAQIGPCQQQRCARTSAPSLSSPEEPSAAKRLCRIRARWARQGPQWRNTQPCRWIERRPTTHGWSEDAPPTAAGAYQREHRHGAKHPLHLALPHHPNAASDAGLPGAMAPAPRMRTRPVSATAPAPCLKTRASQHRPDMDPKGCIAAQSCPVQPGFWTRLNHQKAQTRSAPCGRRAIHHHILVPHSRPNPVAMTGSQLTISTA